MSTIRRFTGLVWIAASLGAPAALAVRLEPVASGFKAPTYVTVAPGQPGRLYVVEQRGRIMAHDMSSGKKTAFLDIRGDVVFGGEAGLLSVAFHPHYAENGRYFINYTANRPDYGNILAEYNVARRAEREILRIPKPYQNHNGGQLVFGRDGYLYMSTGDGGGAGDPLSAGQDKTTLLAKILRLDVDHGDPYGIPADNPFTEGRRETWAWGLRNAWRFSFDRVTGTLFAGDVGQDRREEIDVIVKGGNYGWSIMEGNLCFNPASGCDKTGLILPIWDYPRTEGICIIGGYVYRGSAIPELQGRYVYGDYGSGRIWGLRYDQTTHTTLGNDLLIDSRLPISSFGEDEHGELLVVSYQGDIYRVVK